MEGLTPSERAALYYQVLEHCQDWKIIYQIAIGPDRFKKLSTTSQGAAASNWKCSEKIKKAYAEIQRNLGALKQEIEHKAVERYKSGEIESANESEKTTGAENINFLDPEEFLKHANQQANRIKDDKERRSWLEMIAKLMNYKEQSDGETTEIKRFYIMKTCENCEIYQHCKGCEFTKCPKVL